MTALTSHRHRAAAAFVAGLALLLTLFPSPGTPAAHADGSAESQLLSLLSSHRSAHGRSSLKVSGDLVAAARRQSQRMADQNHLHHTPNLGGSVSGWQKVGENVGRGPTAERIHNGWVNSGSHNANMLDAEWIEVGIGVVVKDGQVWATQIFRVPSSAPAPAPEPKPAPKPAPAPAPKPAPAPAASAPSPGPAAAPAPTPEPAPEPEPEPEPEPHEVAEVAPSVDRVQLILARLEARSA